MATFLGNLKSSVVGKTLGVGDALIYSVGRSRVGQSLVSRGQVQLQHLDRARSNFDRYGGGMTITITRFVPMRSGE